MQPILMTLALVAAAGFFAWTANRRWAQLFSGASEPRFTLADAKSLAAALPELIARLTDVAVYALGQRKMPQGRYRLAGVAHMAIFGGFGVLGLNTILLWGRGYDEHFDLFGVFARGTLLGDGYSLAKELFAAAVVVGALVFVYYRVVAKSQRMTLGVEGLVILGIIISMMLSDFLYVGATLAREARIAGGSPAFHVWEPIGSVVAKLIYGLPNGWLRGLEHAGFWWHAGMVLFFGNLLPYSKHFHIITSLPNVFTRNQTPRGALPPERARPLVEGQSRSLHLHRVRPLQRQLPRLHHGQEALAEAPHARAPRSPQRRRGRAHRRRRRACEPGAHPRPRRRRRAALLAHHARRARGRLLP
jgi:hypothetical protein